MTGEMFEVALSGPGSRWLTEKGLVLEALKEPAGITVVSEVKATILDELCYWTVEIDRLLAELKLGENSNEVRHYLSVLTEAYGALELAERNPQKSESSIRRAKVLVFTLSRMVKTLRKTLAKRSYPESEPQQGS